MPSPATHCKEEKRKEKEKKEEEARVDKDKKAAEKHLEDARRASKAAADKVKAAAAAMAKFGPATGTPAPTPSSTPSSPPSARSRVTTELILLARVLLVSNHLTMLMIVDLFLAHLCLETEW